MVNKSIIGKLDETTTALFICDIQEYFINKAKKLNIILENNKCLIESSKLLNMPIIMTKHDPTQFGEIIEYLKPNDEYKKVFTKSSYSMYNKELKEYIKNNYPNLKSIILTGYESYVCVLQTALDLLEDDGYEVHIVIDATDAVNEEEHKYCLKRFKQSGIFLISTEAVLFQLFKDDNHKESKNIFQLIKNRNYDNNKF